MRVTPMLAFMLPTQVQVGLFEDAQLELQQRQLTDITTGK